MGKCYIFGAVEGTVSEFAPTECDYVIAADAGYLTLKKLGIKPDIVIGDFDSLGDEPSDENTARHPAIKNDTDTLLAIKAGFDKGYKDFVIYGCLGGRLDQTIASLQSAIHIVDNGGTCFLCESNFTATAIKNTTVHFNESCKGIISVFALNGDAEGVDLCGLSYPLTDARLTPSYPLGVSNEFTGTPASVTVKNGILTIMWHGSPEDITVAEDI